MKTEVNITYEDFAETYQLLEIARLNEVLQRHGIADVEIRKAICADMAWRNGEFLDFSWFEENGQKVCPTLCFLQRDESDQTKVGEYNPTLLVPTSLFAFHEQASDNTSWYFDERQADVSEIKMGVI